eukprot:scaffold823_cov219-Amphora_coffeaeformis.AAC.35
MTVFIDKDDKLQSTILQCIEYDCHERQVGIFNRIHTYRKLRIYVSEVLVTGSGVCDHGVEEDWEALRKVGRKKKKKQFLITASLSTAAPTTAASVSTVAVSYCLVRIAEAKPSWNGA